MGRSHTPATGPDGEFRLPLPAGGAFLLICAADDHQPAAVLVNAGVGEVRRVLALAGAGRIEGRITDRQHRPIGAPRSTLTDLGGTVVATATTDADGRYRLSGLDQSDYMLTATAAHARRRHPDHLARPHPRPTWCWPWARRSPAGCAPPSPGRPVPEASVVAVDQAGEVAGAHHHRPRRPLRTARPSARHLHGRRERPRPGRHPGRVSGEHLDHDILLGASPVTAGSPT